MSNTNIHSSEWEDFETELRRRKRSCDEFDVFEQVAPMVGSGIQPLHGTITVRHRRSGTKRIYAAGHGSSWVADFTRDLEAGVL